MKTLNLILAAAMIALLAGCSTAPQVTGRVGPAPAKVGISNPVAKGWLVVATATVTHADGDNTYYYPHTSYGIYTPDGKRFKWVENHIGLDDESPTPVSLPAGNYDVHADSDFGPVIVPVVIAAGKTTEVKLDTAGEKGSRNTNDTSVVWLPKGKARAYYPIGWRADSANAKEE